MGEAMSQGLDVQKATPKSGGQTLSVVHELSRDNRQSVIAIDSTFAAGIVQDSTFVYSSPASVSQRSNASKIFIRALDIVGSVTILLLAAPLMFVIAFLITIVCGGRACTGKKEWGKTERFLPYISPERW